MNCHGSHDENNENNENNNKGHKGHMLMMLVCCGAPLLLFLVLPLLRGGYASGTGGFLPLLISLICPIMMIGMMFMMMRGNGNKS